MIKRIILTDFMAYAQAELELGPGLTVLTGPNNSGKSAVVEALRCLATNPPAKGFIRHGAKSSSVEVELDDGARVVWLRKPAYAMYEVRRPGTAPVTYAKCYQKMPEEVVDLLRLNRVALEGKKDRELIDVHLGNQREPIFLLNKPGTAVASFFASSSESAHLLAMQHRLKERIRTTKRSEIELRTRLGDVEQTLDRLAGLPEAGLGLEAARELFERSRAAAAVLPGLERVLAGTRELGRRIARSGDRRTALEAVRTPPVLWPAVGLARLLGSMRTLGAAEAGAAHRLAGLAGLEARAVPALFDVRGLSRTCAALAEGARRTGAAATRLDRLRPLVQPPSLFPMAPLARDLARCRLLGDTTARLEARTRVLDGLRQGPALHPVAGLAEACLTLRGLAAREAKAAAELAGCEARLETLHRTIETRLAEIGDCPLCGGALDAGHFIKGEHGHGAA